MLGGAWAILGSVGGGGDSRQPNTFKCDVSECVDDALSCFASMIVCMTCRPYTTPVCLSIISVVPANHDSQPSPHLQ